MCLTSYYKGFISYYGESFIVLHRAQLTTYKHVHQMVASLKKWLGALRSKISCIHLHKVICFKFFEFEKSWKVLETNLSSLYLPTEDTVKPSSLQEINKSNLVLIKELHSHNTLSHQTNERSGLFRACIYFNHKYSPENNFKRVICTRRKHHHIM